VNATPLLGVGLVLGLRHALEADHVAAVASLATRGSSWRDILRVAAWWGLGHALVILLVGLAVSELRIGLPLWLQGHADGLAGLVLVGLGVDVLRRLRAVHAEASGAEGVRAIARGASRRALVVGGLHGLAGSAALVVALVPAAGSAAGVLAYLAVFGAGSIVGMGLCSLALSLPLQVGVRHMGGLARAVRLTIGASSVVVGMWLALRPTG
jgi:hypothetical protein